MKFYWKISVERKTALAVSQAMIGLLKPHQKKVRTITSDNGKKFAGHEQIAKKLKANSYFPHLYSSWERGLNENTNGLIRQYFSKKPGLHNDYAIVDQYSDGKIEQSTQKEIWTPDT
jgi:IS30 family transposase